MLSFVRLIPLLWTISECHSNFYVTNYLQFDCLHYYSIHPITPTKIEYCLRPSDDSPTTVIDFLNTRDQNYTFNELLDMNVTAYEILLWSASMDLAERYQYYIDQENKSSLSNEIFFNCTKPWFGPRCQYSSELNNI